MIHNACCSVFVCFFSLCFAWPATTARAAEETSDTPKPPLRLEVPRTDRAPAIAGRIDDDDAWADAVRVRGLAFADTPDFLEGQLRRWLRIEPNTQHGQTRDGRPITFWLMWDAEHLYIAGRSPVGKDETLIADVRQARDRPVLIHDDLYEFAVDASPAGLAEDAEPGVRMSTINPVGFTHHRRFAPDFKPNAVIHRLDLELDVASEVWTDEDGRRWWDVQVAYDLDDLGVSDRLEAGDEVRISLARVLQFPWRYASLPTSGRYMKSPGLPIATLVEGKAAERAAAAVVNPFGEDIDTDADARRAPDFLPMRPHLSELPVSLPRVDSRSQTLQLEADTRSITLPKRERAAAIRIAVLPMGHDEAVKVSTSPAVSDVRLHGHIQLAELPAGVYRLHVALLDAAGEALVERTLPPFEKIEGGAGARTKTGTRTSRTLPPHAPATSGGCPWTPTRNASARNPRFAISLPSPSA
ncbi:MAG: hypothetical protein ACOC1G_03390 [Phycisphaeraceae bacterium]